MDIPRCQTCSSLVVVDTVPTPGLVDDEYLERRVCTNDGCLTNVSPDLAHTV